MTWEDIWSQGDPGYTHTVSSTSIASAPNTNWKSDREKETPSPKMIKGLTWVRWRQAAASCDLETLLAFWRGGVCRELGSDLILQWECHREIF